MSDDVIVIARDNLSPSITDTIYKSDGTVQVLTGASVRFRMRPVSGSSLTVDRGASIVSATAGTVSYTPVAPDTATEGEYRAWWQVTLSGGAIQDSPEFKVIVDAHGPGVGVSTGEVADLTRQFMPVTWAALSDDNRYGDRMLQGRIDYVKYRLFATVVNPGLEATIYNPLVNNYMAMVSALQIIPAGIEYWMEQHTSEATTGTQESVSYPDRIGALERTREWLTMEIARVRPELDATFVVRRTGNYPKVGNALDLRTPDPTKFPKQTDFSGFDPTSTTLPWSPF